VVSGRAHGFLTTRLAGRERLRIEEIHGLHLKFDGNDLAVIDSMISNMKDAPEGLVKNLQVFTSLVRGFDADVVISDFESFAWAWARLHRLPLISIDNMQVLNRCAHDDFANDNASFAFRLAKLAVKSKLPGAYHYLVSSFFYPPVRKARTTLVPPILRPEILAAKREPGDHVLVYTTAAANADALLTTLHQLPYSFRAYGTGRTGVTGNVDCRGFSETGFVDDLRTARCVVAGGGYSLMGEAVHLHVPMLSIPVQGQYEQELNARYLELLGYGRFADAPDVDGIRAFVEDAPTMQHALEAYTPRDNGMLFDCLDELLRNVDLDEPPPERLTTKNLGSYGGSHKGLTGSMKRVLIDDVGATEGHTNPTLTRKKP
ncbi:MAG TPA: glycosyltransferase family protein, partial [Myxococcota bacterium]